MLTFATVYEKGDREINEDYIGWGQDGESWCFAVADGLGGHGRGEEASQLVVKSALDSFQENGLSVTFLQEAFETCQQELLNYQKVTHMTSDMKTTLVICCINGDSLRWAHIGDSRLYLFEKRKRLVQRTMDHSVPQMLVYAGEIREKDIRFHPDRNRLMKVMGTEWNRPDEYEQSEVVDRKKQQAILMCTDGFWELIDEKAIAKCLHKAKSVQEWAELMKEVILENGHERNMDNFSAICVWLD